jgi:3-deoxy-D-manno-octulosonic-acid transferase
VENELWPARIAVCWKARIPVMVIGARLSERSAKRWHLTGGLMAQMLGQIAFISAQDAASEARFLALGLPPQALGRRINLKAGVIASYPKANPLPRNRTLLAASTHEGEEALILAAFAANRASFDHLILAPRHATRGDEVARLIAAHGLRFARRAEGAMPQPDRPVFLADTTGEMDLWYPMAAVTIIGGSFADRGGHTPFEPAAYGSALIHGPSIHNFAEVFATLAAHDACIAVPDAKGLIAALATLTPEQTQRLAQNATKALSGGTDIAGVVAAIIARAQPKG